MRTALPAALALVALCGASGACGSDLPAQSFIDKLRILAVKTEPPEVPPGTPSTASVLAVEPFVAHVDGGPVASPAAFWLACRTPPGALQPEPCGVGADAGIPPDCGSGVPSSVCLIGSGNKVQFTPDSSVLGADNTGEVLLTVVVSDLDGGAIQCLLDIQANGGKPAYPDRCVVAFKRLVVNGNAGAALNTNPRLTAFTLTPKDGAPLSLTDGSATFPPGTDKLQTSFTLDATRADDAPEMEANGNYEALSLSWFTTSGKIDSGRSEFIPQGCASAADCPSKLPASDATTKWTVPKPEQLATTTISDNGQAVAFWAILRDDRGGVSWLPGTATPAQ